jgi:hypothetical protein
MCICRQTYHFDKKIYFFYACLSDIKKNAFSTHLPLSVDLHMTFFFMVKVQKLLRICFFMHVKFNIN